MILPPFLPQALVKAMTGTTGNLKLCFYESINLLFDRPSSQAHMSVDRAPQVFPIPISYLMAGRKLEIIHLSDYEPKLETGEQFIAKSIKRKLKKDS